MSTQSPLSHVPTIALSTGRSGSRQPKYEPEVLVALCESIEHWWRNWYWAERGVREEISTSGEDCALCDLFWDEENDEVHCGLCPVMMRTGRRQCRGTPWVRADTSMYRRELNVYAFKSEYQFLVILLPDKEEVVDE